MERTNEKFRLQRLHDVCFKDLTGKKFNRLTVLGVDHKDGKVYYWKCLCECGNITVVAGNSIKSGHTKSCGCIKHGNQLADLSGRKFGMLTALEPVKLETGKYVWLCECECGGRKLVPPAYLVGGTTKSCGCMTSKLKSKSALNRYTDITGQKFNHLTALHYLGHSLWDCVCDCGNPVHKSVKLADLRRGFVQSCGCVNIAKSGSVVEREIKEFIRDILPDVKITKERILDGYEIDIYIDELKFGIEYCGSIFHSTSGGLYRDISKYYHRNKFLIAKKYGIRLITIFDVDVESNRDDIFDLIRCILLDTENHTPPCEDVIYTNNDIDDGKWLLRYGYKEVKQMEPDFYVYKNKCVVYRCGKTMWSSLS